MRKHTTLHTGSLGSANEASKRNNSTLKHFFIFPIFLIILSAVSLNGWGQIAAWDFTGNNTANATVAATTFNANLSSSNLITRGGTAAASAAANSFRTLGFKNEGIATTNTDYFQITLGAATGYVVSLSTIDAKFAGTATFCASPGTSNRFAYSIDGTNFTLISTTQTLIGTPATLTQIDLSGISALQNVAAGTTITLRYYASGQTTTGGWGFYSASAGTNGLAIGGSVTSSGTPNIALANNGTQVAAANVSAGTTAHILHKFQLGVTTSNASLTGMTCTTAGSYASADITNLKVRYSADATLDVADATLSTYTTPGAAGAKTFPAFTSQTINSGSTGYIFITADIAAGATVGNNINVNAVATTDLTFASGNKSGSTTAGGLQTFTAATPQVVLADNGTQVAAANVIQGTTSHIIHKIQLGVTVTGTNFTGLDVVTAGSYIATDITNLKVRYSTDNALDAGDATLSTYTNPGTAGTKTFPSFTSQAISAGATGYIFITADIAAAATVGNTISINAITTAQLTFSAGTKSGTTTAGGAQTFVAPSTSCGSETFTSATLTASYLTGSFTGDNSVTWSYVDSRDESTYGITGKGIMYKGATTAKLTSGSVAGGIGNFTCSLKKGFTGAGNRQVELFVNGMSVGTSIAWDNTTVQTFTVNNINVSGNVVVEIRNITTNQVVVDDISWTCYNPTCTAPTTQSSAITFASIGPDQMTVNWTSGNGSKRIVIMNTSNTFTNPTDGTDPTADPIYAGSGQQVVYNDAGSSVTVSDLIPGTTYWYRVYDYNCTGASTKYITATAANNPNSQATTSCAAPTTQASALTFSAVGTNQMTVNWTNGNGANRVVIMNTANSFTNPANGTSPAANSIYSGSGEQVVYNNNSNSITVTGLNPATTYWFRVYENNCAGTFTVYQTSTSGTNPLSQATTACAAPTTQATALAFSGISNDQMTVNWTNGNGSKRIVIINTSNSFTNPVNGTDPTADPVYSGSGEQVVYNGNTSSVTVTGLSSATAYWFRVYEANCTGASVYFFVNPATNNPLSQATTSSTFSACGNQGFADGFTEPGGWTFTGITSTYATSGNYGISSPSVKFDDELDEIETAEVSGPTQLSFWIKGLSINPNSEFLVEGWDGDSWETLELIKPIPTVGTTKTYGSVATYSKFRLNYSKKMAGNVAIDDVNITCGACVLTTFPQLETFDAVGEPNLPCGWSQTNDNADGEYWITSSANPYSGDNSMYISNNSALAMDDWFFSTKLTLVGGTIYNISFYYRAGLNTYTEKLEVKWGTAANAAGMTGGTIFTNAAITNESYAQGTGPFTPGSSGDYYIGFHGYSAANQIEIYVDDILITNCSGAPAAPTTSAATSIGGTYFTANWSTVSAANKYFLDVATDAAFTTFVTGFSNKDVGNVTSYNISGLNINTTYYYRVRSNNSCGTSASSGTINLTTLATTTSTTIDYGDLVILAVNANMGSGGSACVTGSNNGDEISFMCFVDITNGTQFQITDNPYERDYSGSGHWGNTEGGAVLTRTGGTIPAGTVITFRTDMTAAHNIVFIQPDAAWSVANLGTNAISTMFNLNNGGDQIYVAQDGQWYGGTNTCATTTCPPSGSGTSACHNATFPGTGRLLFAFSTNPSPHWTASCSASPTQRSNLYPGMECLNMAPTGSSDWNKYVGLLTPATQREWIDRINDPTSWTSYSSCTNYDANGPQYDDGMILTILTGGFANGHWNGSVNIDWFNCANWQSMKVPDSNTNVVIPQSGVLYEPTIGAPPTGITTAYSNDLSVELLRTLTINNASSKLSIYGSFINDGALSHTLGTVTLAGSAHTTLGGNAPLTFYNLTLNKKNYPFKVTLSEDIATSSIFTLNKGKMLTGSYIVYVQNNVPGAVVAEANNALFAYSYIIGSINRMITANTSTYDFPVGVLSNPRLAQFVNNSISATTLTATYDSTALIGNTGTLNVYEGTTLLTNLCMEGVWQIDPNAALTSGDYGLKLWFNGYSSLSAADDNNFTIIKRPNPPTAPGDFGTFINGNGTINPLNGLGRLYSNGYAYKYNLTAFSQFAIAKANTPLPVELLFFAAECIGNAIEIKWQTATETNNEYFSLERSADAKNFKKIAEVKGAGNSNEVLNYSFIDADPLDGTSYYRLVQYDYDGRSETFGPVTARCEGVGNNDFQIVHVTNDGVNPQITYYISTNTKVTICVYDINGRRILCDEQAGEAGNRQLNLDIKTGAGLYFISLTDGDKVLSTRVFIK